MWEAASTAVSWGATAMRYGFIPFIIIYAMKKDPRIRWSDLLHQEGPPM